MVFSELIFFVRFFTITILVYYLSPRKFRNLVLFIASLIFYSWGEPKYILLMLFSTVLDFFIGRLVYKYKVNNQHKKAKMAILASVTINLLLLGFFKYCDFFIGSLNNIFNLNIELLKVVLPIGISFYTFQTMSYSLDIYMNDEEPQNNIISFGTYVVLFPQLIAGPIVRYQDIANELRYRKENFDDFFIGVRYFVIGLGKKVLLANNIGNVWDQIKIMNTADTTVVMSWIGIIAFALQIYFDFSGYSDMAIGLGRMFGFKFPINFNYPYISKSISEFWRRWHITLGVWFREYVYIPLGGNRCKKIINIRNILIVWFLTGFWHGAAYNFILWGIYFGVILIIEKTLLLNILNRLPSFVSHIYALTLIMIGWVIFEFEKVSSIGNYLKTMFGIRCNGFINDETIYLLSQYWLVFIILIIASTPLPKYIANKLFNRLKEIKLQWVSFVLENAFNLCTIIVSVAYMVAASYNPFLYFRF